MTAVHGASYFFLSPVLSDFVLNLPNRNITKQFWRKSINYHEAVLAKIDLRIVQVLKLCPNRNTNADFEDISLSP